MKPIREYNMSKKSGNIFVGLGNYCYLCILII
nr:MAG TPA: hypothetical protein [Crassvirales sp.]